MPTFMAASLARAWACVAGAIHPSAWMRRSKAATIRSTMPWISRLASGGKWRAT